MNKIFNKLFWVMAVCGLTMTACSDDIDWNPGAAADGQGSSSLRVNQAV